MRRAVAAALAITVTACTERGLPGVEYRWSSQSEWESAPRARHGSDDEFLVRMRVPDLGPRPAMRLYQPEALESADVGGTTIEIADRWAVKRLPPASAGSYLTLRYRTRYTVPQPVVEFGSEDSLASHAVRKDLGPFGIGVAMMLLGLGALASLLIRRSWAWFFFGTFAVSIGIMVCLEVQDFYVLLPGVGAIRDPLHEASLFAIGASFSAFVAVVFPARLTRTLRGLAISAAAFGMLVLVLHVGGVLAARRLRFIAEAHIATALVLALAVTIPERSRGSRVFLAGIAILLATGLPDMLAGLGVLDMHFIHWGLACFVLCIGYVLYGHYGHKELELEQRVRDVEALNAELRHQIAERSRELARHFPERPAMELPKIGSTVAGRYEVLREIGAGGMGHVFEVVRSSDNAHFALKVMGGQSGLDVARFAREAEIAAKLSHPNLVSVVDVGVGSWGWPFIVMELVTGGTLAERKLEPHEVRPVLAKIARGLVALHDARVVHRDLKPSNVLVYGDGSSLEVKLADFGIARAMASPFDATQQASENVTKAGAFLGTPLYMAPEQALGAESVAPAADVFSFGVIAYELWSGALPFSMPLVFLVMSNTALPEPPSFDRFVDDQRLRALLQSCLFHAPDKRPSAAELAAALEA